MEELEMIIGKYKRVRLKDSGIMVTALHEVDTERSGMLEFEDDEGCYGFIGGCLDEEVELI